MLNKRYIGYILNNEYGDIKELTSKNIGKYNKIINLLSNYKDEYNNLNNENLIIDYLLSKLDKRYKFKENYMSNKYLYLILKLYRDIEFNGATSLSIDSIKEEFNYYYDIEGQLETMKSEGYLNVESIADLHQIRFLR